MRTSVHDMQSLLYTPLVIIRVTKVLHTKYFCFVIRFSLCFAACLFWSVLNHSLSYL